MPSPSLILPRYEIDLIDKNGHMAREWYQFFALIVNSIGPSVTSSADLQGVGLDDLDSAATDWAALPGLIDAARLAVLEADLDEAPARQDMADALVLANAALDQADAFSLRGITDNATSTAITISSDKNVTINAPTSGVALVVAGATGNFSARFDGADAAVIAVNSTAATNRSAMAFEQASVVVGRIGADGTHALLSDSTNSDLSIVSAGNSVRLGGTAGGTTALKIAAAGNVTINAPSSGTALTLNSFSASTEALTSLGRVALTGQGNQQIEILPFGAGAVLQNALQFFQDNNAYIDAPATGTPTGGAMLLRTGAGTTTALVLAANQTASFAGPVQIAASPLVSATTQSVTGLANKKTSDTTSGSATLTADAALTVTCNETGYYKVEVFLGFYEATLGTGGFQFDLNAGSATVGGILLGLDGFSTAALTNAAITSITTATASATIATAAAAPSWYFATGSMQITVAGTFGVRWAQNTLSVNLTTLKALSYITLTKIG